MKTIKLERSIIPSCDVSNLEKLNELVKETCNVEGIGAYKIGFELALKFGIPSVVEVIRKHTTLPIIYDHQKAGTDIPEMGDKFMESVEGVDAIILFPVMGPITEKAWIKAAKEAKLNVIIGGEMTHPGFSEKEGGFISEEESLKIYEIAATEGVTEFVVPGNKPEQIKKYRKFIESKGIKPIFYSPGLITQGGDITESAKVAGRWHAIVGRALYNAKNINQVAKDMVKALQ